MSRGLPFSSLSPDVRVGLEIRSEFGLVASAPPCFGGSCDHERGGVEAVQTEKAFSFPLQHEFSPSCVFIAREAKLGLSFTLQTNKNLDSNRLVEADSSSRHQFMRCIAYLFQGCRLQIRTMFGPKANQGSRLDR